jgi:hypothetical protein
VTSPRLDGFKDRRWGSVGPGSKNGRFDRDAEPYMAFMRADCKLPIGGMALGKSLGLAVFYNFAT